MSTYLRNSVQRFELKWELNSPLLIGSELESPEYDIPVLKIFRNGEEVPYIPGSSIKGVLRNSIDRVLLSNSLEACNITDMHETCGTRNKNKVIKAQKQNNRGAILDIIEDFCIPCRIFGSHGFRGRARIGDAYPSQKPDPSFVLSSRFGVAIDRLTGKVIHGPFEAEYIGPRSSFKSTVICSNLKQYEIALLMKILSDFNRGRFRLGAFTTKGFGEVKVQIASYSELELLEDSHDRMIQLPDSEDISNAIFKWANSTWNEHLETIDVEQFKSKDFSKRESRTVRGKRSMDVRGRKQTSRRYTDKSKSGIIYYDLIPKRGYEVFIGAGFETLPVSVLDNQTKDAIKNCRSFSSIIRNLSKSKLADTRTYKQFSQQVRLGVDTLPVIPGSTLKGVFRSRMEFMFEPVNGVVDACFVIQGRSDRGGSSTHKKLYGDFSGIERRATCNDLHYPCVVCDLFGMTSRRDGLRGLLALGDAKLIGGTITATDISITERKTARLIVARNEKDNDATAFRGSIRFTNLGKERLGLLFDAMAHYEPSGIRIGRFHYRDRSDDPIDFGRMLVGVKGMEFDDGRILTGSKIKKYIDKCRKIARERYEIRNLSEIEEVG